MRIAADTSVVVRSLVRDDQQLAGQRQPHRQRRRDQRRRHLEQSARERRQRLGRQAAMGLVHRFRQRVTDAGAEPDRRRLLDADPGGRPRADAAIPCPAPASWHTRTAGGQVPALLPEQPRHDIHGMGNWLRHAYDRIGFRICDAVEPRLAGLKAAAVGVEAAAALTGPLFQSRETA